MGKGEIARYEQFLLFPQCFQKACFQGRQKVSLCGNGLTAKVISWQSCVSWLSHTNTNKTFFPKPPTTFLTCFSRGQPWKYAWRKFTSTKNQTHNHQVVGLTCSPLIFPHGVRVEKEKCFFPWIVLQRVNILYCRATIKIIILIFLFKPLPHMLNLGSPNSAANDGKNMDKWGYNYLLE